MLRKFWLLFAQACTLCLGALFVVATLRPDLLPRLTAGKGNNVVLLREATQGPRCRRRCRAPSTYADAAKKAMPAVVNIYTSKAVRSRNPLLDDSILRRYFPDLAERAPTRRATSLGSGVIVSPEGYVLTNHHVIDGADDIELRAGRRPRDARAHQGRRSRIRPRRAEGRRRQPADDHVRHRRTACRSATSCSRSAIRSASATPSRTASSARSAATTSASTGSRISSRPTPRSIPAIPAARSSTAPAT